MAISIFNIKYPEDFKLKNDIILKVKENGGSVYYKGDNIFRIECDRKVKKKLEKEINDMLKT